jgi:hypothetical protein
MILAIARTGYGDRSRVHQACFAPPTPGRRRDFTMVEPIDFNARLAAKRNEASDLPSLAEMKLDASRRLAEVINDMRSKLALNNEEVVVLLRRAIDVLEGHRKK